MSERTFNPASKLELLIRCFYQGIPKSDDKSDENFMLLDEMRAEGLLFFNSEELFTTTDLGTARAECALRTPKPELKQLYVDANGEPIIWTK